MNISYYQKINGTYGFDSKRESEKAMLVRYIHDNFDSKCVNSIKWLDANNVEHEYYFLFKSNALTGLGVNETNIMTHGDEKRIIQVKNDEHTSKLTKGKRLIFDERVWEITGIDRLSTVGLVSFIVKESTIDTSKDNLELRIANYYNTYESSNVPTDPIEDITIVGADYIRQGSTASYSVTVDVTWSLLDEQGTLSTNLAAIISQTGTQCSIKANKNGIGYVTLLGTLQDSTTVSKKIQIKTTY